MNSQLDALMQKAKKPTKERGFVAEKIATYKSKKHRVLARGRKGQSEATGYLSKVIKKAVSIAELLTREDQEENLRVIREAKKATHHVFNTETKKLELVPDHKTRLAAVVLDLGYSEGKPVDRQLNLNVKYDELSEDLKLLKNSPAGRRFMESIGMVQKSGGERVGEDMEQFQDDGKNRVVTLEK
jgi:hypothetical protein